MIRKGIALTPSHADHGLFHQYKIIERVINIVIK